ncbi:transmembrane protein 161B-like [Physella acuta]|uniref:transmembrane protein 161B-like n=1 Tax=Physella acuta TaxID=109671 RepID=UPI0027DBE8C4|nr:transmembrane protein 161B-like [Physella acuta]XP_059154543.1 transmembrane protein 161B-like [Physella acuta]
MAILGVQVVFSLVMFTFLHKLAPYYSIGRWILSKRLYRYLHPTNEELKQLAAGNTTGKPANLSGKAKRRKNTQAASPDETFTVPRNIPLELDQAQVEDIDLVTLQYYSEYTWLMDFSLSALVIYVLTEIYYVITPHRIEFNLSVLWCLLAVAFCVKILASQAWLYMRTEEGGERVLLFTFTFFFLVFAMGVLVVGDNIIEFGIEEGYKNFSLNAIEFLEKQGTSSHGPVSFLTFKIVLAVMGMLVGALLTFPGLRMAKLHLDTLKYTQGRKIMQMIVQLNYVLPFVLILLWVKPVGRDLLCGKTMRFGKSLFYENQFDGFRLHILIIMCGLRLMLMPVFLQTHLNLAHEKVENIKKETGRISNTELQKTVARVFYYLCVVAIQYAAPILLILFTTFLLKTLGGFSWSSLFGETAEEFFNGGTKPVTKYPSINIDSSAVNSIMDSAAHLTGALGDIKGIFSSVWYRGVITYFLWWVVTAWFSSTSLGVMYYSQSS